MSLDELEEIQYWVAWSMKHAERAVEAAKKADELLDKLATQRSPTTREAVATEQPCPSCKGIGSGCIDGMPWICTVCKGSGRV